MLEIQYTFSEPLTVIHPGQYLNQIEGIINQYDDTPEGYSHIGYIRAYKLEAKAAQENNIHVVEVADDEDKISWQKSRKYFSLWIRFLARYNL